MDFHEISRKRRMVRNYTGEPVDRTVIDRIVDSGRRAPTAGHSQGVAFVVVTKAVKRAELASLAGESEYVGRGFDPWISRAPVHVVIAVSEEVYHRRYREPDKLQEDGSEIDWPIPYWWVDAGASMMAILLAAVAEGLSAGFVGAHAVSGLRTAVGLPDEYRPIGIVTIGHGAPDRRSGSLDRGRRDDVVRYETWG